MSWFRFVIFFLPISLLCKMSYIYHTIYWGSAQNWINENLIIQQYLQHLCYNIQYIVIEFTSLVMVIVWFFRALSSLCCVDMLDSKTVDRHVDSFYRTFQQIGLQWGTVFKEYWHITWHITGENLQAYCSGFWGCCWPSCSQLVSPASHSFPPTLWQYFPWTFSCYTTSIQLNKLQLYKPSLYLKYLFADIYFKYELCCNILFCRNGQKNCIIRIHSGQCHSIIYKAFFRGNINREKCSPFGLFFQGCILNF